MTTPPADPTPPNCALCRDTGLVYDDPNQHDYGDRPSMSCCVCVKGALLELEAERATDAWIARHAEDELRCADCGSVMDPAPQEPVCRRCEAESRADHP